MIGIEIKLTCNNEYISITTPVSNPIDAILLDAWENRYNYGSSNIDDHSAYIKTNLFLSQHIYTADYITYNIPSYCIGLPKFTGVYIVNIVFKSSVGVEIIADNTTILYDPSIFYCFRSQLLNSLCPPCDNLRSYHKLELLMFREQMFKDSATIGNIDEAIAWFEEAIRVVGQKSPCCKQHNLINSVLKTADGGDFGIGIIGTDYPQFVGD
jgi:hypothetical protein